MDDVFNVFRRNHLVLIDRCFNNSGLAHVENIRVGCLVCTDEHVWCARAMWLKGNSSS